MNKLFIALIVSGAAVSGFYWFTKNTTIEEATGLITVNVPRRAKESRSIASSNDVVHGMRHSLRDRLRAVKAPTDMIDQLVVKH